MGRLRVEDVVGVEGAFQRAHQFDFGGALVVGDGFVLGDAETVLGRDRAIQFRRFVLHDVFDRGARGIDRRVVAGRLHRVMQIAVADMTEGE
jgi:hypothetical protein